MLFCLLDRVASSPAITDLTPQLMLSFHIFTYLSFFLLLKLTEYNKYIIYLQ